MTIIQPILAIVNIVRKGFLLNFQTFFETRGIFPGAASAHKKRAAVGRPFKPCYLFAFTIAAILSLSGGWLYSSTTRALEGARFA